MSPNRESKDRYSFRPQDTDASIDSNRGSFRREPPVVPERVAVMKANYRQAWLFFLMIVCLLVAWAIPIRYMLIRTLAFRPADTETGSVQEFVAIAYEGISDIPTEVSAKKFKAQMELLKEKGYQAITLQQVKSFYEEGKPLPDKAILLTFDHSRKSSYFDARRVLQKLGWRAVMFVWTKPILDEDPSALRWPYIRAMIKSGAWEAGAQSHSGFERIVGDSEGGLRNYLTSPRWLQESGRYETPDEFRARLNADHEYVYNLILDETKTAPIAFAFPYGDFGQYDERALLTRRLNMELADQYYDLAFIHGNAALNTRYTDPMRLNRLLVNPEWSAEQLFQRLESAWPRESGVTNEQAMSDPLLWQVDWGDFSMEGDKVIFKALDDNTGSKVWLNGTDLYQDFQGHFKLKIEKGQVGFFLRASKDGESHLYFGMGDKGEVWLRQKSPGVEAVTLGTSRYTMGEDGIVDLELYLRENHFFAAVGGKAVFDEIMVTRGEPSPGIIGLSVWDPEMAAAEFELLNVKMEPFYNRMVTWMDVGSRQPYLSGWMGKNGYRYTALAPPWLRFGEQGKTEQIGWDANYYSELARVYNLEFFPEVIVERIDNVEMAFAEGLAERALEMGADGVFCNLSRLRGVGNLSKITTWIQNMSQALDENHIQLVVSLPPGIVSENTINTILKGLENIKIASRNEEVKELDNFRFTNDRLVGWENVNIKSEDYPLYTQLSGSDSMEDFAKNEVRGHILWEQGFNMFNKGNFQSAITYWTRWSEIEPYNEKPPRLIGDAYQRLQEYPKAIDFYQKSLDLNPGQVNLVVITANLLEQFSRKPEEALQLLSLYQRLFPDNSEISLAQAALFLRQGQGQEAEKRIQQVVLKNPDDLTALALLHPLLQSSQARIENIEKIKELGTRLGTYEHLARVLNLYQLLLWPESWRIMGLVEARAAEKDDLALLYKPMVPRTTVVRENLKLSFASDNWINQADKTLAEEPGSLLLSAAPTSAEAAMILKNSEGLRNGFIEATLKEARGFFWLYARRSEGNMIRFGFEHNGRLYIQIWSKGELVTNINREWEPPAGALKLTLEVRGDAVYGYVDGRAAFGAPIQIPNDMNLGWWGMAPWSAQLGVAQAVVSEIAGGPLPVNIGMYRGNPGEDSDRMLVQKVQPNTQTLSIFSPTWFFQDGSGQVRSEVQENYPSLRLLTRYHKIRLYPLVKSATARGLRLDQLAELAETSKVDGFVLEFFQMPDEDWFAEAEKELINKRLGLLAVHVTAMGKVLEVRELGTASSIFAGARKVHDLPVVDLSFEENPVIPLPAVLTKAVKTTEEESSEERPPAVIAPATPDTIYVF